MITINDFWRIDDLIKNKYGKKWYHHIDYCCLHSVRPLEREQYFCTPRNSITFARTGGDGVHFGFLTENKLEISDGPVIMTVPMAEKNNIVVAENFEEFLSIGYHIGWCGLEQLAYNEDSTIEFYSKPDPEISKDEQLFLELIRDQFNIKFKPLSKNRLIELKNKYFNKLVIDEFNEELLDPEYRKIVDDFIEKNNKKK